MRPLSAACWDVAMERVTDSLPARIFLLACNPDKERRAWGDTLGYAVRAAVLVELAERGCLSDADGKARPVGDRRTGDPVLDAVLRGLAEHGRPRRWRTLVARARRQTLQSLEEQLVTAGEIRVERRALRRDRVVLREPGLPGRLRAEALETLESSTPVEQVPRAEAALAAMAALGKLAPELNWQVRHRNRKRIKELTKRGGPAVTGLKKALDSRNAAAASSASSSAS
ncbi:hypothetical protein SCA03_56400 [Streptomyces cacaoi]|uniref:GPP34 family phosphoprotein n=2 Tax=Streptomyces TaxID=1883 RepID=A0A4Y3R6U8_STRCI|nr:hypothetical protein SCA03_56400 [Streptomyces cacaoi]